jgi:hypothetical protein
MANAITSSQPGQNGARLLELEKRCSDLAADNQTLREELAAVRRERDDYLKALYPHVAHEDFAFTKEEAFGYLGKEPPLEQIITDLEREAGA